MEGAHNACWVLPAETLTKITPRPKRGWLDRTASLWEIEGVAMEDGWAVVGFAAWTGRPYWQPATPCQSRGLDAPRGQLRLLPGTIFAP